MRYIMIPMMDNMKPDIEDPVCYGSIVRNNL